VLRNGRQQFTDSDRFPAHFGGMCFRCLAPGEKFALYLAFVVPTDAPELFAPDGAF
jgi:hypothetical protein